MVLCIPDVLTGDQIADARHNLSRAAWIDGRVTAGPQSARTKDNLQLDERDPAGRQLGDLIISSLQQSTLFMSAALPLHVLPPFFNKYEAGGAFGNHIDNAIRVVSGTGRRVRTDLSATLFLADPDEYDGGELCLEDTFGVQRIKLPAGDVVLYPASSLHHVTPVTRGSRLAAFFWIQSMIRDDGQRTLLFDLDTAIQGLSVDVPQHPSIIQLTGVYHNLLRQWAEL